MNLKPIFNRSFSGLLFDMDGTIINSFASTERAWGNWARANGIDPATFLPTMHGIRGVDLIGAMGRPDLDPRAESAKVLAAEMADVEGIVPTVVVVAAAGAGTGEDCAAAGASAPSASAFAVSSTCW